MEAPTPASADPRRGRLCIYTGPVPGVGKTRRMLEDARGLRAAGGDVVAAFVDARGRSDVEALAGGLAQVPPRVVEYRGVRACEVDVEAVIARRPKIALVDDLAHVNAPENRRSRRHHDVDALRAAGIDVMATVGIEHLDSLNELVHRLTGVTVSGTIPDAVLQTADAVVHVDASVDTLLSRLDAGQIYPPEKLAWARAGFFRAEALLAMRELSLRQTAEALARDPVKAASPVAPQVSGRVLVGLSSFSPRAMELLRRGSRIAGRLNTHWFVVYVETPAEAPGRVAPEVRRHLAQCVAKAQELGAEVRFIHAHDSVRALVDFARAHGVAHIVVGRSHRPWWRNVLGRSMLARLVGEAVGFDLHILSTEGGPE